MAGNLNVGLMLGVGRAANPTTRTYLLQPAKSKGGPMTNEEQQHVLNPRVAAFAGHCADAGAPLSDSELTKLDRLMNRLDAGGFTSGSACFWPIPTRPFNIMSADGLPHLKLG